MRSWDGMSAPDQHEVVSRANRTSKGPFLSMDETAGLTGSIQQRQGWRGLGSLGTSARPPLPGPRPRRSCHLLRASGSSRCCVKIPPRRTAPEERALDVCGGFQQGDSPRESAVASGPPSRTRSSANSIPPLPTTARGQESGGLWEPSKETAPHARGGSPMHRDPCSGGDPGLGTPRKVRTTRRPDSWKSFAARHGLCYPSPPAGAGIHDGTRSTSRSLHAARTH